MFLSPFRKVRKLLGFYSPEAIGWRILLPVSGYSFREGVAVDAEDDGGF